MKGRSRYGDMYAQVCLPQLQENNETTGRKGWFNYFEQLPFYKKNTKSDDSDFSMSFYFMCVMAFMLPGELNRLAFFCMCKRTLR